MATYDDVINQFSPLAHFKMGAFSGSNIQNVGNTITYTANNIAHFGINASLLTTDLADGAITNNGLGLFEKIADVPNLHMKVGRSISFLFNIHSTMTSSDRYLFGASSSSSYGVYIDSTNSNRIALYIGSVSYDIKTNLTIGQTYHVTISHTSLGIKCYIDGVLEFTSTASAQDQHITYLNKQATAIMDEVCFHDHVFTDADALKLFTATRSLNITINGTISEDLIAADFNIRAHRLDNSDLTASTTTSSGSFSLVVPDIPHYVVALAEQGVRHETSHAYILDDLVFPSNVVSTPYYFKCTTAGTSGAVEPAWQTVVGSTTSDGSAVWTMVEHLIQPVAHSPIIS